MRFDSIRRTASAFRYSSIVLSRTGAYRLSRPESCWVALDDEVIKQHVAATDALSKAGMVFANQLTSREVAATFSRLQTINGVIPTRCSPRTLRRWRRSLRQGGNDPLSLTPRTRFKGNRTIRLSLVERKVVDESLKSTYQSPTSPSVSGAYRQYLLDHAEAQARMELPAASCPVCYTTYLLISRRLNRQATALARGGKRLAHAAAPPTPPECRHLKPLRAFERAHIDHYKCDIHVLLSGQADERITRRPWLSLLRDEYSGAVIAVSISLLDPSRRSCMSVLRDCVRRNGRLPETIIADNGKEFGSEYFELFLARYGVAKVSRPPGAPRFGGSVESVFRSFKEFLRNLPGNTHNDAKGRSASASHRGEALASMDIHLLHRVVNEFYFDVFNAHPVSTALESPSYLLRTALDKFPHSGVPVLFDSTFLANSALPLSRKLTLDPGRGIRHLGRWFCASDLPRVQTRLSVFEEPWDSDKLYALVDGRLVTCIHGAYTALNEVPDVDRVIDSILFMECSGRRAKLSAKKSKELAAAARRIIDSIATPPNPVDPAPDTGCELPPTRKGLRPFRSGRSS